MRLPIFLFFTFIFSYSFSQHPDKKLEKILTELIQPFHGNAALYVKDLNTGKTVAINADSIYPTASMVKVPILIGIMEKINRDELKFHQEIIYNDSLLYPGVDILGSFKNGEKIELSKLMMLMMTMSDNTASRYLQMFAGTGKTINSIIDSLGFHNTRVNSKTPGREVARERYGWGQTTPREMASLIEKIYRGKVISPAASARMLRIMNRNYWDAEAISQVPPYATVFSKSGALDEYRSEVVLVRGIKSAYVFCIITNNNADRSWTYNNEAWKLIRNVSNILWNYFEPRHEWKLPEGSEKFY
ncbi:MAG TPA: serine hydrolase [Flavitalea sp.]|nr:serine hydrolase [Flavitalea sp.]